MHDGASRVGSQRAAQMHACARSQVSKWPRKVSGLAGQVKANGWSTAGTLRPLRTDHRPQAQWNRALLSISRSAFVAIAPRERRREETRTKAESWRARIAPLPASSPSDGERGMNQRAPLHAQYLGALCSRVIHTREQRLVCFPLLRFLLFVAPHCPLRLGASSSAPGLISGSSNARFSGRASGEGNIAGSRLAAETRGETWSVAKRAE